MKNHSPSTSITKENWKKFITKKSSVFSLFIFIILLFFSITAEFWTNSKPILLRYKGQNYFPIYINYHPSEFDIHDIYVMDYRNLKLNNKDWSLWPFFRWDPYESNSKLTRFPAPPSSENIFGTDDRGRDLFARIIYGFRYTFLFAFGVWFLSYLLGTALGATFGYFGGKIDLLGMRLIEIIDSMPSLLILITLVSIFKPSLLILIIFSVFFGWTHIATYIRAEVLSLRKREFVDSARIQGASNFRIIWRHILPNALTPLFTLSPFSIASQILILTNMDYLGLGLPVPTPSWGELISQAQKYMAAAEWLVWWPSFFITITLLSLINIGLTLREINDKRRSL